VGIDHRPSGQPYLARDADRCAGLIGRAPAAASEACLPIEQWWTELHSLTLEEAAFEHDGEVIEAIVQATINWHALPLCLKTSSRTLAEHQSWYITTTESIDAVTYIRSGKAI